MPTGAGCPKCGGSGMISKAVPEPTDEQQTVIDAIMQVLGDVVTMYFHAHGYHWNVQGQDFSQYHALFEAIYEDVYGSIDPFAENILKLGGEAPRSVTQFLDTADLDDQAEASNDPVALAEDLAADNDVVLASLNDLFTIATDANEQGIANFTADRIDQHQKWGWQLKASTPVNKGETYSPPMGVRSAARRALKMIADGQAGGGFTDVGRKRASDLAAGHSVSLDTVKRMHSFFARHEVDKQAKGWGGPDPTPGKVAWLAWGGDAGKAWADSIVNRVEKEWGIPQADVAKSATPAFVGCTDKSVNEVSKMCDHKGTATGKKCKGCGEIKKTGDKQGHPFRGNQHTRAGALGGVSVRSKSFRSTAAPKPAAKRVRTPKVEAPPAKSVAPVTIDADDHTMTTHEHLVHSVGPVNASEMSYSTGIPERRTKEILNRLSQHGFAKKIKIDRVDHFYAPKTTYVAGSKTTVGSRAKSGGNWMTVAHANRMAERRNSLRSSMYGR
ncbi:DNA-binding protein Dps [uncultured Caudovirales phage]|uniref:DNA-binding protein Dps n=1 Tax=uncultured Caudovirales phage TaxID=2100421 RepID=A0A6J7WVS4_9CAUD|nr:DNA-binding protein Dps [uncultured Caudovirales phage]